MDSTTSPGNELLAVPHDAPSYLDLAMLAVRTHCAISWPSGAFCLNCHQRFPCHTHNWASTVLCDAGWTNEAIGKLDSRTGPWS
jgi:hypothetical protein